MVGCLFVIPNGGLPMGNRLWLIVMIFSFLFTAIFVAIIDYLGDTQQNNAVKGYYEDLDNFMKK